MLTDFRSPFPVQPRADIKPTVMPNRQQLINQALGGKRIAALSGQQEEEKAQYVPRKCVWATMDGKILVQKTIEGPIYVSFNACRFLEYVYMGIALYFAFRQSKKFI